MIPRLLACLLLASACSCEKQSETPPQQPGGNIPASLTDAPEISGENALFHAVRIAAIGDRSPASPGYRKQLDYLKQELSKYGWTCQEQTFTANSPKGAVNFVNLRARYGTNLEFNSSIKLLVSCHIDTKTGIPGFVGANDGASGAALILELARALQKEPALARQIEFVLFDGEESFAPNMTASDGLYGSTYYASRLAAPLPSCLVNLDMVGRQGKKIRISPDTPQHLYELYNDVVENLNLSRATWGVSQTYVYDDHIPFVKKGIPSINIIDDFRDGNWWHTSNDNINILSAESFEESGKFTLSLIRRILK